MPADSRLAGLVRSLFAEPEAPLGQAPFKGGYRPTYPGEQELPQLVPPLKTRDIELPPQSLGKPLNLGGPVSLPAAPPSQPQGPARPVTARGTEIPAGMSYSSGPHEYGTSALSVLQRLQGGQTPEQRYPELERRALEQEFMMNSAPGSEYGQMGAMARESEAAAQRALAPEASRVYQRQQYDRLQQLLLPKQVEGQYGLQRADVEGQYGLQKQGLANEAQVQVGRDQAASRIAAAQAGAFGRMAQARANELGAAIEQAGGIANLTPDLVAKLIADLDAVMLRSGGQ